MVASGVVHVACAVLILHAAWAMGQTPTLFKSSVQWYGDPYMPGAGLNGTIEYDFASGRVVLDLPSTSSWGGAVYEKATSTLQTRCGTGTSCVADFTARASELWEFFNGTQGDFTQSNTMTAVDGRSCRLVTKATVPATAFEYVIELYVDAAGLPCRAEFSGGSPLSSNGRVKSGRKLDFWDMQAVSSSSVMAPAWTSNCPASSARCHGVLDLVLVVDGSQDPEEFEKEKAAAVSLVNAFVVNQQSGARIAVVLMEAGASLVLNFDNNGESVIRFINSLDPAGRSVSTPRCYPCAIEAAEQAFISDANAFSSRQGHTQGVIFLAGGAPTVRAADLASSTASACPPVGSLYMVALGITNGFGSQIAQVDLVTLSCGNRLRLSSVELTAWDQVAANAADVAREFCAVADSVRGDAQVGPCGGRCNGVCGCNRQCECPAFCGDLDGGCQNGFCEGPAKAGGGCICATRTTCNQTFSACVEGSGTYPSCTEFPKTCTASLSNKCAVSLCNSATGCYTEQIACPLPSDVCKYSSCSPSTGCEEKTGAICGVAESAASVSWAKVGILLPWCAIFAFKSS